MYNEVLDVSGIIIFQKKDRTHKKQILCLLVFFRKINCPDHAFKSFSCRRIFFDQIKSPEKMYTSPFFHLYNFIYRALLQYRHITVPTAVFLPLVFFIYTFFPLHLKLRLKLTAKALCQITLQDWMRHTFNNLSGIYAFI